MRFIKNKEESIFSLEDNTLGISFNKHAENSDELFLSCSALKIENMNLYTEDFDNAVELAKVIVTNKAVSLYKEVCKFAEDKSKIEFE